MSDPNWWPHGFVDTMPAEHPKPRCPPCNGDCLQGRQCDAAAIETARGGLLLMAALIVAVLGTIAILVWPR